MSRIRTHNGLPHINKTRDNIDYNIKIFAILVNTIKFENINQYLEEVYNFKYYNSSGHLLCLI